MTDFRQVQLEKLEFGRVAETTKKNEIQIQQQGRLLSLQNTKLDNIGNKNKIDFQFKRSFLKIENDIRLIASNTSVLRNINLNLEKLIQLYSKSSNILDSELLYKKVSTQPVKKKSFYDNLVSKAAPNLPFYGALLGMQNLGPLNLLNPLQMAKIARKLHVSTGLVGHAGSVAGGALLGGAGTASYGLYKLYKHIKKADVNEYIHREHKPVSKTQNALLGAASAGMLAKHTGPAALGAALGSKGVTGSIASSLLHTLGPTAGGALPIILLGALMGASKGSFKERLSENLLKLKDEKQTASKIGVSVTQTRLLTTPARIIFRRFGQNIQDQKLGLQIVSIDLLRLIAGELVNIRRNAFDLSDSFVNQTTKSKKISVIKKIDAVLSSIVGFGDIFTSLKSIITAPVKAASKIKTFLDKIFTISGGIDEKQILKKAGLSLTQRQRAEIAQEHIPQLLEDLKLVNVQQLEVQENIYILLNKLTKSLTGISSKFVETRKGEKQAKFFDIFAGKFETKKEKELSEARRKNILENIIEQERGIISTLFANIFKKQGARTTEDLIQRVFQFAPNEQLLQFRTKQEEVEEQARPVGVKLLATRRGRQELKERLENELFLFRELFKKRAESVANLEGTVPSEVSLDEFSEIEQNSFDLWFHQFDDFQQHLFKRFDQLIKCSCKCSDPNFRKNEVDKLISDFNNFFNNRTEESGNVAVLSGSPVSTLKNSKTIGDQIEDEINAIFQTKATISDRISERKKKKKEDTLVTSNVEISQDIKELVGLVEKGQKKGEIKDNLGGFLSFLGTRLSGLFKFSKGIIKKLFLMPFLGGLAGSLTAAFSSMSKMLFANPRIWLKIGVGAIVAGGLVTMISDVVDGWQEEGIIGALKGIFKTDGSIWKGLSKYGFYAATIGSFIGGPPGFIVGALLGGAFGSILAIIGDEKIVKKWEDLNKWITANVVDPILSFIKHPFEILKQILGISTREIESSIKDERLLFYHEKRKKLLEKIAITKDKDEQKILLKQLNIIGKEIHDISEPQKKKEQFKQLKDKVSNQDKTNKSKLAVPAAAAGGVIQSKDKEPSFFQKSLSFGSKVLEKGFGHFFGKQKHSAIPTAITVSSNKLKDPKNLHTSQSGIELIKKLENIGNLVQVYNDQGHPAIGYGHNKTRKDTFNFDQSGYVTVGSEKIKISNFTLHDAERLLKEDLKTSENVIHRAVTHPITQSMFDSLTSLVYNVGPRLFFDTISGSKIAPKLLSALNSGDFETASKEMLDINKSKGRILPGLTKRRQIEKDLFSSVYSTDLDVMNQSEHKNVSFNENPVLESAVGFNQAKFLSKLDKVHDSNIQLVSLLLNNQQNNQQNNKPVILPIEQSRTNDDIVTDTGLTQFSPTQDRIVEQLFSLTPTNLMFSLNQLSGREDYNLFPI